MSEYDMLAAVAAKFAGRRRYAFAVTVGPQLVVVIEGESGYYPITSAAPEKDLRAMASRFNHDLGLDPEAVQRLVIASMFPPEKS